MGHEEVGTRKPKGREAFQEEGTVFQAEEAANAPMLHRPMCGEFKEEKERQQSTWSTKSKGGEVWDEAAERPEPQHVGHRDEGDVKNVTNKASYFTGSSQEAQTIDDRDIGKGRIT